MFLVGVFNISSGTVGNLINYAVVIDAGSSHTSTFLYKLTWLEDESFNTSSKIEQVFDCTFDKGVAEFVENVAALDPLLGQCIKESVRNFPPERDLNSTRIFLGATAGMRLLQLDSPSDSQKVLDE